MIDHGIFPVEPWGVREKRLDLDLIAETESVFALANGHLGLRGNLDEGEPVDTPGTYLNAFYEVRPLPHAETAYGLPDAGQTVVNVKLGRLCTQADFTASPHCWGEQLYCNFLSNGI